MVWPLTILVAYVVAKWAIEKFESKALTVMKNHLKLACHIHVINDTRRERMFWSYRLPVYVIAVIILAGVLVFLTSVLLHK